jgi:protein-tyrosine phosphatase
MPEYRCKIFEIEGVKNIRDIGGYRGRGGTLARGRFIRAGSLAGLTDAGRNALLREGVDCVVDLRSGFERKEKPGRVTEEHGMADFHVPMMDFIHSSSAQDYAWLPESLEQLYHHTLHGGGADFLRAFKIFAEDYRCILFNCTAGKDRTGMTAMLLLGLAGVSEEDIIEDYSYSHELQDRIILPGFPEFLFYSNPGTMRATIDMLNRDFGGIINYLEHIGVNAQTRAKICDKLGVEKEE